MRLYYYRCLDKDNKIAKGKIMSVNRDSAEKELKSRFLLPLSVKRRFVFSIDLKELFAKDRPLSAKTLYILSSRLYAMTDSGVDLQKALSLVAGQSKKDNRLYYILRQIQIKIGSGEALSDSFSSFSCFPDFFVSMIEIGEKSGNLPASFLELTRYYEWEDKSLSDVKSAMLYPMVVCVLLFAVVIAALTLIIPAYSRLFESNGILLPLPTRILISMGGFVTKHFFALLSALIFMTLSAAVYFRLPRGKAVLDYLRLNFPVIKNIYISLLNYRLSHAVSILLSAGVSLTVSLDHAFRALNAPYLKTRLNGILNDVNKGVSFGNCMKKVKYFDHILISMIETGEETGRLPYMLGLSSEHFKHELERTVKNLNTLIEPLVTILLGAVICVVLLAVVLPSFSMIEAL